MNRLIGLALGAMIGLAWPVCAVEHEDTVPAELVLTHFKRNGDQYSQTEFLYRSALECETQRINAMSTWWEAVMRYGYQTWMKARCYVIL